MKKLGLWLTSICLIVCSAFAFAGCNFGKKPDGESSVGVTQKYVELSESEISMEIYTQHTLTVVTNVEEAMVWTTSDASVATVEDGVITACLEGSATITATAGAESATCVVTVTHLSSFPEIILSSDALELVEGGDGILVTATASYKGEAVDCEFTWVTANPSIATVENGKVTPVGIGTTTVTVTAVCMGETLAREIPVVVNVDEIIQVSKPTLALALAQVTAGDMTADTFTVEAYRKGVAVDTAFTVASSNEEVATVLLNGKEITVTAVGEGDCHISVYYDSENGRIQSFVEVNVYRSKIAMREEVRVNYNGEETVLDLTVLALAGEFEGVYANGELVSDADGKLAKAFVEVYKGSVINVEIRTSVAVYSARLRIVVPYIAKVVQGDSRAKMPTYTGDVTTLGFAAGTTVYTIDNATPDNVYTDGWNKRAIISTSAVQDYVTMEFVATKDIMGNAGVFHVWGEDGGTDMNAIWTTTRGDALITNMDGSAIGGIAAGTHYLVHIYCEGLTEIQVGLISGGNTVYFANIACNNGTFGVVEPPVSQGEMRGPMPTYDGDVAALGFEEGTVVYEIDGPQGDATDVKLVALVDATGDNAFAKLDFVLSKATTSIGLWITAKDIHLGYYTITPTGFTTDGHGDPSRNIFVTDANGESVTSFDANKVYTLYVGLDGREATIQLSTWADLTVYVANIDCITEAEAPVEPTPPPAQGEEISILFIGNSFSDDTEAYMVDILLSLGYTNINIGNLYIGGCSIDTHYKNIMSNAKNYEFRMRSHNGKKYTEYEPITIDGVRRSLGFAIAYKDWDIISVQQASGDSGKADSYNNLDALVAEVKKQATNADVEIVFNMTWAYQSDCTHAQFPDYNSDQMTMYNAIVNAVQSKVTYTVVPNGTAIQNARTSLLGDNLTRDGYHLDLTVGRFIAGLTFVAKVTGVDITDIEYAPGTMNELQIAIAIESVQNALAHPFTITESEIEEEVVVDPDVYAGGSNTTAVTVYKGDVTALGFAEGTTVYEYVGVDSSKDKAGIKVDSANYDYVDVQFVIGSGNGYFFLHGRKGNTWYNNGTSYIIDPSWLRLGDGKNTPSDRVIEVFDAQGKKVTALMSTNVLYTLRVYTKLGELDEILISIGGSTIYFANVTQGLEAELPQPDKEGPIKQGDTTAALPNYKGDATAHGFAEGEYLQYMVTETVGDVWGDKGPTSGKTREQLAAKIPGQTGKYVTVQFAVSEDIASGNVFYVWGLLDGNHTKNGFIDFTTTTYGRILDVGGNPVTSLVKNTVYVLELYIEGTNTYKVANICATGMEVYFAADSITYSDTAMEGVPVEKDTITAGGSNTNAVSKYVGDVTALGFAEGTTVYEYVGVNSDTDKVAIKVDSANYDYVDVQFVIAKGDGYFFLFGRKGGNWHNGGLSYVVDPGWLRLGDGTSSDRVIEVFDAQGNKVTALMSTNTLYTLRVFTKVGELDEILIGKNGSTIYLANVKQGLESELPQPEKEGPIKQGDTQVSMPNYEGDETAVGFEEGEYLQYMVTETTDNVWAAEPTSGKTREQLAAKIYGEAGKYVTIKFSTSEDIASGSVFYVWGLLEQNYTENGGLNFTSTTYGRILDENGYAVTSIKKNTVYILELYIEGTDTYKVSNVCSTGMEIYFAADSITCSDTSMEVKNA